VYLDSLSERRQEELLASSMARLEPFVYDPLIRQVLTSRACSFDFGDVIDNHRIFIANLELYRPWRPDDVILMGRLLINDIISHVFATPKEKRGPVYLLIDEVQNFATRDLCSVLDMGRELGLHCIFAHHHLHQLMEDQSGYLLHSVLTSARSKAIFGGCSPEDLEIMMKLTMLDQFDPMSVKDEITSLETRYVESTREVHSSSESWSQSDGRSHTDGYTQTSGTTTSQSSSFGESIASSMMGRLARAFRLPSTSIGIRTKNP
jgi:hypothetical protein